jgi:hypothetical protein
MVLGRLSGWGGASAVVALPEVLNLLMAYCEGRFGIENYFLAIQFYSLYT